MLCWIGAEQSSWLQLSRNFVIDQETDMDTMLIAQVKQATDRQLFIAFELAQRHWRLAFTDGVGRPRLVTLEAGDRVAVRTAIAKARAHFGSMKRRRW